LWCGVLYPHIIGYVANVNVFAGRAHVGRH
jgi:hypothetical protein